MKRATPEEVRILLQSAKRQVSFPQVLHVKALVSVVLHTLGESDERERLDVCVSKVQDAWTELQKAYEKSRRMLESINGEFEERKLSQDRGTTQAAHEIRKNFKTTLQLLRERLKDSLPQYFADHLYNDRQSPADMVQKVKDDDQLRRRFKSLERVDAVLTPSGTAEISLHWTLGFTATILAFDSSYPDVTLTPTHPGHNISAFLRLFQAQIETKIPMANNLPFELCKWVEQNLSGMFVTPCKNCGRILSFVSGTPLLPMVGDNKGDFYHEECIREPID